MSSILECHCGTFYTQSIVFSYFGSVFDDFEINFVKEVWFFFFLFVSKSICNLGF